MSKWCTPSTDNDFGSNDKPPSRATSAFDPPLTVEEECHVQLPDGEHQYIQTTQAEQGFEHLIHTVMEEEKE